ncbi:prohibitin family protein [uncultured Brachyspira sp.]|uniref:prohibitin family protein n=1 Tax=uncultured Brachyspira sp. TaxID=221953 RepID=UPI0025F04CF6|nr:prohibitin family protein [uncultured Brachyspira sp.]
MRIIGFNSNKLHRILFIMLPVIAAIGFFIFSSITIVSTGEIGIRSRLGKAISQEEPGLHFRIPFIDTIKIMEVREQTVEKIYSVSSKDMQTISMTLNVQYSIGSDALDLYKKFGLDYKDKLINPRISESLNAVSARYTIEEFITKRNEMAQELLKEVMADFNDYGITVAACSIIEHDFSDEFDQAIERKLIASQDALTAQNALEKVRYEAEAEITKAKGVSEANRIMQESLTPLLIQRMYIEKWDGKMPQVAGSGISPMIQIK